MTVKTDASVPTLNPIGLMQAEVGSRSSNKSSCNLLFFIDITELIQHNSTKCHKMSKIN